MSVKYSADAVERWMSLKEREGLTPVHRAILERLPAEGRVLEIGCASGYLSAAMKANGCRVTGVELIPEMAGKARERADTVIIGDFQDPAVQAQIPKDHTVIVMADVIEHFADPWSAILSLKGFCEKDALWLVTFPNVAFWKVRWKLLRGKWEYTEFGVLDRTHLRFFTRASFERFLSEVGLKIRSVRPVYVEYPGKKLLAKLGLGGVADGLARRFCPRLFGMVFLSVSATEGR